MDIETENYQLKWHSFGTYLHGCIASSVNGDCFADVSLMTMDGKQIQAHKFILSACSQYLHQVLKMHQTKLSNANVPLSIILPPEINYKTLKVLVQYMYSGETTVSQDILESVLRGGDLLKVRGLWRPREEAPQPPSSQERRMNIRLHQNSSSTTSSTTTTTASSSSQNKTQSAPTGAPSPATSTHSGHNHHHQSAGVIKEPNANKKPQQEESVIKTTHNTSKSGATDINGKPNDCSKSLMQLLVIKEEPIEWTEVNQEDIELVEREEIFDSEMIIKPEVQMMEEEEESEHENPEELYTPLTCELCSETFSLPADWVKHVQLHTDMMPAKRQKRGRSSTDEDNTNFPPLQCDMCLEYFATPAKWVQHVQNAHTEQEMHATNNATSNNQKQSTHRSSTTTAATNTAAIDGVAPASGGGTSGVSTTTTKFSPRKTCSVCNKGFPSHASMLIHKRTHTGERPYMCDFCCKGFNVKSNLLRHLRTLHDRYMNPTEVEIKEADEAAAASPQ